MIAYGIIVAIAVFVTFYGVEVIDFLATRKLVRERDRLKEQRAKQELAGCMDMIVQRAEGLRNLQNSACPYRKRGYGGIMCYQADVVASKLDMKDVYCMVTELDCRECGKSRPTPTCTKDFYRDPTPERKGGERE